MHNPFTAAKINPAKNGAIKTKTLLAVLPEFIRQKQSAECLHVFQDFHACPHELSTVIQTQPMGCQFQLRYHPFRSRRSIAFLFFLTFLLIFHQPNGCWAVRQKQPNAGSFCLFPESSERQFFFDIRSDTAPRSIVLDTVVEPPDARLAIANVRSNNLPSVSN